MNADDLGNITLGYAYNDSCNRQYSIRMRANHTGVLRSIRPFFIWDYSRIGSRGQRRPIQTQVLADDGSSSHFPSGNAIASLTVLHPVNDSIGF
ncbi:MAG: hypothetical protein IPI84_14345, partial [Holophagaceae bacterium]|nr:hypothetical protein [Holophagaceae bacterium]